MAEVSQSPMDFSKKWFNNFTASTLQYIYREQK